MQVKISQACYPIRGSFTISRGSRTEANTVIVELTQDGVTGRGECVPYARYNESIASVTAQIEAVQAALFDGMSGEDLAQLMPSGAARNAVDCALWDLRCKAQGKRIWDVLDLAPQSLTTAYTLSLDTPEKMYEVARENAHRALLKLKLGGGSEDLDRVKAVREAAPDSDIILDANEAWTLDEYQSFIPELEKLRIRMIEQPFPAKDNALLDGLPRPIPICADESCHDLHSLPELIGRYDMINIKIDKTGGLTEALALKAEAEKAGLDVMVGCMLSSSLSMAPAFVVAQNAAIVDLDGPLLLAEDVDNAFTFDGSTMLPFSGALWG